MSLCQEGLDAQVTSTTVSVVVDASEPLLQLANPLDWGQLAALALPDLQQTAKGCWWRGRKLHLRTHLGVLVLQSLVKETDRGMEQRIRQTPLYQVFCGSGVVPDWKCRDHTKMMTFRNRLSPASHKQIGEAVLPVAHALGFADPTWMEVDSTVQAANMAYPADAQRMRKLAHTGAKVLAFCKKAKLGDVPAALHVDLPGINRKAKAYFFLAKNTALDKRRAVFQASHRLVKQQLQPLLAFVLTLRPAVVVALPWHIRQALDHLTSHSGRYLLDVAHFIRPHTIKPDKLRKGKVGKENEFGRVFQLGRIGGNFLIPFTCTDVRMEDTQSLLPAIGEHAEICGAGGLEAVGTDKGYYSATNIREVEQAGINADGIQRPCQVKDRPPAEVADPLRNRRAGIEPLIGHAKAFGLGHSKMKADLTTVASGYRAVMGFTLHQLLRYLGSQKEEQSRSPAQHHHTPKKAALVLPLKLRSQFIIYFATATN